MEFKTLKNLQAYYNEMVEKANTATGTILPVNVLTTKNLVQNLTAQFDKTETPESVTGPKVPSNSITVVHNKVVQDCEYIGRPSALGNPFTHKKGTQADIVVESREKAVECYREWLLEQVYELETPAVISELQRLISVYEAKGYLNLGCWCAPKACHGDIIKDVLLAMLEEGMHTKPKQPSSVSEPKTEEPKAPSIPPQVEERKPGKKKRDFELVPSQRAELDNIKRWFNGSKGYGKYELAGFAGVGKSTVIDFLLEELGLSPFRVRMCAPTGTAALVLRDKTPGYDAITIHRLIYKWDTVNGKNVRLVVDDNIVGAKLVIADESSMTTREEGENLIAMCKSAKVKLLIVGDPGQLPPVDPKAEKEGRKPDFFLLNPDGFLREVMRQAADNPIIKMSMAVRAATVAGVAYEFPMNERQIGKSIFLRSKTELQLHTVAKMLQGDGALIVGTNNTRKAFNAALRAFFGFDKPTLMDGEKILIKENCEGGEVTNGMRGTVSDVRMLSNGLIGFIFTPDKFEGSHYLEVHPDILFERKTKKQMSWENKERRDRNEKMIDLGVEAFFGYAITCHASQGSQWKNVYVIDEGWAFNRTHDKGVQVRTKEEANELQNRWTYTAVTRAAENLVVFRGGRLSIPSPEQAKAMAAQLGVKPSTPSPAPKLETVKVFDGESSQKIEIDSSVMVELIKKTELYCSTYTESRLKDGEASSSLKGRDIPNLVKMGWELKGTMLMPGYRGEDDPYELDAYFTKADGGYIYRLCFGYDNGSYMDGRGEKSDYEAGYGISRYNGDHDIIAALYREDADIQEDDVFIPVSN